jgi:hypothetical protein
MYEARNTEALIGDEGLHGESAAAVVRQSSDAARLLGTQEG